MTNLAVRAGNENVPEMAAASGPRPGSGWTDLQLAGGELRIGQVQMNLLDPLSLQCHHELTLFIIS